MSARLSATFDRLKRERRAGFIPYIMAGDPDMARTREVLMALPDAGADIVELGFPFTDPTADGPTIAAAGQRALASGTTLQGVLNLVAEFRDRHPDTPLILMGYANPVARMGEAAFAKAAEAAGVDGVIVVDLPPEEDQVLRGNLDDVGVALIRLTTPTTDAARLARVLQNATGFIYYVSATGVTGAVALVETSVKDRLDSVRAVSDLPIAVGFGVRTAEQAAAMAQIADAVVVGSAIVDTLEKAGVEAALDLVRELSGATRTAQKGVLA